MGKEIMSNDIAESLAKEIQNGTYTPTEFIDCQPELPVDQNPHQVRYTQFTLFSNPNRNVRLPKEPEYLILQQYQLYTPPGSPAPKPILINLVKPLARHLSLELEKSPPVPLPSGMATRPISTLPADILPDRLPLPDDPRIDLIRDIAEKMQIPSYHPNLPDADLRDIYKDWFDEQRRDQFLNILEPLERAGFTFNEELAGDLKDSMAVLEKVFGKVFLPEPYQPYRNPYPHFGLCAIFEQVWEPKGYTRGELINTISLAPGEQLTLEIHSWDKSTFKREDELITESELRRSETLTQRDSLTVTRETTTKFGAHLDASGKVTIHGVPVNLDGGVSSEVTNKLNQTLEQARERTVESSNSLKTTRKLRIEVSREVGREQKQTRVITNTNRCHTLNCHYFEVMSNYLVTTRFVRVQPCLLLPNPKVKVTLTWVLCHEDVLKQNLLDKVYLDGFDGARMLETHEEFLKLVKEDAKVKGAVPDPLQAELKQHVDAVLAAYAKLKDSVHDVKKHAKSPECRAAAVAGGALGLAVCVAAKSGITDLRQVLYMATLSVNEQAINALKTLSNSSENAKASESLRSFFAVVTPRDFQFNPATAAVAKGLDALGVPGKLVDGLLGWGLLDLLADDAGLYNAVKAAAAKLENSYELPPQDQGVTTQEGFLLMDVAKAQTAFDQLKCHIEDNWLHYLQAIWTREIADQRFLRLQGYGSIAAILDNQLLGFLGHKAAYPITDLEAVKRWIDFAEIISQVSEEMQKEEPQPQLITMPTLGTVLEAIVGECDACEDFIQQSRLIDLRVQDAKAKQEESEANRYQKRVENGDYSDPEMLTAGKIVIDIGGNQTQPPS